ncbi:hypothetical protein [Rhizobium leguminosarum]|uniref:hypothetical protein n=1 Tax=Rhizobium leguminosarum TaxID=384 RepID=UPI00103D2DE2|nr:hypothetical protein E0H43_24285 [Rhizobium leguminosarum bv. viciae]
MNSENMLQQAVTRLAVAAKHLNIESTILERWEYPREINASPSDDPNGRRLTQVLSGLAL